MKRIIPKENKHYPINIFMGADGRYHYLYKIVNNVNGKYYFGIHTTNNYHDTYSGSGSAHIRALKKYGAENFSMYVLKFYNSRDELCAAEARIVNDVLINDPQCYNLANGGKLGSCGLIVGTDGAGDSILVRRDDPRWISGEVVGITKGKVLARDSKNNTVLVDKNDPRWISGEVVGITKGKVLVIDAAGNITNVDRDRVDGINYKPIGTGRIHIHKNGNEKFIYKDELPKYLADGWLKGSPKSSITRDKIYINDGKINKCIYKNELPKYLADGWAKGRYKTLTERRWIFTKDGAKKYVTELEVPKYLADGWVPSIKYKQTHQK